MDNGELFPLSLRLEVDTIDLGDGDRYPFRRG